MRICFSILNTVCYVNYYWVKLLVKSLEIYLLLIVQRRIVKKVCCCFFFFFFFFSFFLFFLFAAKVVKGITYTGISVRL